MACSRRTKRMFPSSPSLSSAETIANNYDLLTHILLCLPIKSLLKFNCVSKHWLSLISNPHFYRRLNLYDSPCALFVQKWPRSDILEYDFIKLDSAFDPARSRHYKVICTCQYEISEPDYHIAVYSSKTGLWRVTAASFTLDNMDFGFYGGVFWNGAIHWYTDSGPSFCFDVDQEQIREMPMPPIPDDWYRRRVIYFGESGGHLNLIEIYHHAATQFNVCELAKDYSGWFVKYRIELEEVIIAFPEMIKTQFEPTVLNYYAYEIWCIVRGESDENSYMVLHMPAKIIRYNLKGKSFKKLCDFPPDSGATGFHEDAMNFRWGNAYTYIRSLAPV
ncbi:hypothetical protein RCOM_1501190 [Ricinus communis]|uniref:F-box domain-containing protein n=1 Tax=Ricinus communis TaxID=3988 RepID=B9R9X5_RICCO|nr:hypothetical protein RCOM_1501190 [Ricinus communis]